ncbi:MAG: hypothetical protein AAF333_02820 [Planctomycetota bacterium]
MVPLGTVLMSVGLLFLVVGWFWFLFAASDIHWVWSWCRFFMPALLVLPVLSDPARNGMPVTLAVGGSLLLARGYSL